MDGDKSRRVDNMISATFREEFPEITIIIIQRTARAVKIYGLGKFFKIEVSTDVIKIFYRRRITIAVAPTFTSIDIPETL